MRKAVLGLCLALGLAGMALADDANELAITSGQRTYTNHTTLIGPSADNLRADLHDMGLVGSFHQETLQLEAVSPSPQLVNDDFVIHSRQYRLEELTPTLPDRSRPYIMDPNNHFDLVQFGLY